MHNCNNSPFCPMTESTTISATKNINNLGRALTAILRHQTDKLNLRPDESGFVPVHKILSLSPSPKTRSKKLLSEYTEDDVKQAVEQDGKNRMSIRYNEKGILEIRVNQGHSSSLGIDPEKIYTKITNANQLPIPGLAIHGTSKKYISAIIKNGLNRMERDYIHFATQEYGSKAMISGMRNRSEVLIYLNVEKTLEDNIPLYLSENQVLLCPNVLSREYFRDIKYL